MQKKSKEQIQIQVGAFLAIGILAVMLIIFMLGAKSNIFQQEYTLTAYFDNISGLKVGAPVQLAGISVGRVDRILFEDELEQKKVKVILQVSTAYKKRIREDSIAKIETQGLLGDRIIIISVGSKDKKELNSGDNMSVENPRGFAELVLSGGKLIDEANEFITSDGKLLFQNIGDLAVEIRKLFKEVNEGKGVVHHVVYGDDGAETMASVKDTLRHVNAVSRNISGITGKVNDGKGTLGALVNDPSLFYDLKTLLGKANRNKLVRSVIRYTLSTREKQDLQR